jgi:hypothetical protein
MIILVIIAVVNTLYLFYLRGKIHENILHTMSGSAIDVKVYTPGLSYDYTALYTYIPSTYVYSTV